MLTREKIIKKLKELGFKDGDLDRVVNDVNQVCLSKASAAAYLSNLIDNKRLKPMNLSEEALLDYIDKNKDNLPKFSTQEFEKIYDETWEDYFSSISD